MKLNLLILGFLLGSSLPVFSQKQSHTFSAQLKIAPELKANFQNNGRMYLFLSQNFNAEPRTQIWPNPMAKTYIFAKNMDRINPGKPLTLANDRGWISTANWTLDHVPAGDYLVQVLWDQDFEESRIDAPGNLYSTPQKIEINQTINLPLVLNQVIEKRSVINHPLAKVVEFKSELLSQWWKKPVHVKAAVLLPHNYNSKKTYPIRYNVSGYGGRYTRINGLVQNEDFIKWWDSEEGPQLITVYLDGEGPFGDSYQMDSENSGPYGASLIQELIPYIESTYRGTNDAEMRFVDGCSTGGWVSLGLQLYYPEVFNGVFSYSPDAIDFENYQLINIYQDKNAYENEFGYQRPVMRSVLGEPMLSLKDFIRYENVLGASNTYLNSGGQFSAHNALYSPKGTNGLPKPLFDPVSGDIDPTVAKAWEKYDFKRYVKTHWKTLGPKLQGKIFIWMGDMDHFYLNPATRSFDAFLKRSTLPTSDAKIVFSPMKGHCAEFSDRTVLEQIQQRIEEIHKTKAVKR
ncbi:alpha/beta hydrolase-fold protein [Flavobacteriaceae bacterium F08102]|nr:alpha/beta hydrolase-fold protein [Flavobacteriaceae bacterium F08102]